MRKATFQLIALTLLLASPAIAQTMPGDESPTLKAETPDMPGLELESPEAYTGTVPEMLDETKTLYSSGEHKQALNILEQISSKIKEERSEGFKDFFPANVEGWQLDESKSEDTVAGSAAFGGGTSLDRVYVYKDRENIQMKVRVIADSPLVEAMMGLFKMAASFSSGDKESKIMEVNGHQAMLKSKPDEPVELNVVVDKIMITFSEAKDAEKLEAKHLVYMAKNMNYDALKQK